MDILRLFADFSPEARNDIDAARSLSPMLFIYFLCYIYAIERFFIYFHILFISSLTPLCQITPIYFHI